MRFKISYFHLFSYQIHSQFLFSTSAPFVSTMFTHNQRTIIHQQQVPDRDGVRGPRRAEGFNIHRFPIHSYWSCLFFLYICSTSNLSYEMRGPKCRYIGLVYTTTDEINSSVYHHPIQVGKHRWIDMLYIFIVKNWVWTGCTNELDTFDFKKKSVWMALRGPY